MGTDCHSLAGQGVRGGMLPLFATDGSEPLVRLADLVASPSVVVRQPPDKSAALEVVCTPSVSRT